MKHFTTSNFYFTLESISKNENRKLLQHKKTQILKIEKSVHKK